MSRISHVEHISGYNLRLTFDDGYILDLDCEPFLTGEVGEPVRNPELFNQFYIESSGGLAWSNGFDFCPNFLRQYKQAA